MNDSFLTRRLCEFLQRRAYLRHHSEYYTSDVSSERLKVTEVLAADSSQMGIGLCYG